ncbi:MAG: PAS domain S-box protein [Prolixibacteraceae bacterium]|nr:PAS domain S-box protein [Prolixibacteraceae bacterium]
MEKNNKSEAANFRQRAEELIKRNPSKSSSIIVQAEMQKIMHELEVHQIELEMQNEELMSIFSERRRAEESIMASESRYRRLFESAKDGILILDAETGMIADVNPFMIEMLGYPKQQFLDKAIWEIGFFKDLFSNQDKFSELQQKGYVRYDDLPLETADGRKISVEFVSNSYFENKKKVIQCNIRETTERKQSELALRNSETHLRTLLQTIPDLIWLKDTNGVYLTCNNMFERFFGAREADIAGKTDYDFVDRELADSFRANDRKAMEAGKPTSNEEWIPFADDGHRAFLETIKTPMYDSDGMLIGVLGIGRDITERKKSEDAMLESEIKYRAFFENSMDAILLTSPDGKILAANQASCVMFGHTEDELIRLGKSAVLDLSDPRISVLMHERKLTGKSRGELTLLRKDGTRFPAEISTAAFKNQEGLERCSMIIRDITERKDSEKALKKSEQLYRSLFENMLNGFAYCKMIYEDGRPQDFIYLAVNNSFEILTGLKDVIGKKVSDVIPGIRKSDPVLFEVYGRVALTGKPETIEIYMEALKMWYSISVYSPVNEHFVTTFDVITKRKNAEEVLRQSEAKFRNLINSLPDPVLVVDSRGRIVFCNEIAMKTFDYNIDEMLNCTMEDLIPKQFRKQHINFRHEFNAEPKSRAMGVGKELFAQRKGGSGFPTEIMLEPVEINGNQFTLAIVRDITERKKIQNEIKFQANLLNNVGQAIIATDLSGNIIYWNNAAEKIYGWSSAEVIGQNIISLTPTQLIQEQDAEIKKKISEGDLWTGEFMAKRKNGSIFPATATNAPFFNSKEELAGVIGISSDITERKLEENELITAKEKAQESDRLKSAFLANMSHEVRTPLNSIIGFSELLLDPDFDEDQKNDFIQHIIASGNNLLNIISDIMDISKMESGEITIRKKHLNARKYLSGVYEQFSFQAGIHKHELVLNLPDDDNETEIFADAERLMQIFNNLIGNAFKFTSEGKIEIGYRHKGEMVEFFVKDTGIGIPASFHHKIFDRFRQVEDAKNRKYGGNGLGLAITKNLVGLMGGKIWVESTEANGSAFYFTIPVN